MGIYEPQNGAMYLSCERTIGSHSRNVANFLVANRNGTLARSRNEHLAYRTCADAAYCGSLPDISRDNKKAPVPMSTNGPWCHVPSQVNHATSCAGQRIESGGTCYPTCLPGYKSTVKTLTCRHGYLIPSVFACHPDKLSHP